MPSGSIGPASGLALRLAEAMRDYATQRDWTTQDLANRIGRSKNYVAERLRGEKVFNLQDFEGFAELLGLDPQELMTRLEYPHTRDYEGRLVPSYGIYGTSRGVEIYREVDADPKAYDEVVGGFEEDDFEVTPGGPKSGLALAANKRPKKVDIPHAE